MRAYYNEHDKYAAQWLRNLIAAGHIANGDVDERSIEDVLPSDLAGYTQCHFFAGIGGWSLALRKAGWPDDRPVWSGSCPCQPFSAAGKGAGVADERHLWPAFHHLIVQCKPSTVFGEQVASRDGLDWLDLVHADMEGTDYAFGAADLCAAGIGAPHIRQRLYFVADAASARPFPRTLRGIRGGKEGARARNAESERLGADGDLADSNGSGQRARRKGQQAVGYGQAAESDRGACELCGYLFDVAKLGRYGCPNCEASGLDDDDDARLEGLGRGHQAESGRIGTVRSITEAGESGRLADNILQQRPDGKPGICTADAAPGWNESAAATSGFRSDSRPGPLNGFWRDADWLYCRDGKFRPVEPGTQPLAHGIPASMGRGKSTLGGMARSNRIIRLRGYGNAIVPELAAEFIRAYLGGE